MISHNGKEYILKNNVCVYIYIHIFIYMYTHVHTHIYITESLCCTAEINIVNRPYFNKKID